MQQVMQRVPFEYDRIPQKVVFCLHSALKQLEAVGI